LPQPAPQSATPDILLRVEGLTKRFRGVTALEDVAFEVHRGEILGLIGPNGSGKTTLFECLGGVLAADAGRVWSAGKPLTPAERSTLLFYLPDAITPWPAQRVRTSLDFIVDFFGGRKADSAAVVERLGLESFIDVPLGQLSKGQRKRALLAMGLLAPQPLLLADEPFDGLDIRQSREVALALRAAVERGRTLFLSIHQLTDAARVCDRFVLLSGGRSCGEGTREELSALAAAHGVKTVSDLEEVFLALT
jgi:ABC-2 type transport system ATP-binding protein